MLILNDGFNYDAYERRYKEGYGIMYPESHIIRIYEYFLVHECGLTGQSGETLLDYGCGNGTHSLYFKSKGFGVYGVDISERAIALCREKMPEESNNFVVIKSAENIEDHFKNKFDVILLNQVLYYLSNKDLESTLNLLRNVLKKDGYIICTMIGTKNLYYNNIEKKLNDGLHKVVLKGRVSTTHQINFVNSKNDLLNKFKMFKPVTVGYYDFQLKDKHSNFHYIFIGKHL